MRQTLLLAGACGVAGGLAGGGLAVWLGAYQQRSRAEVAVAEAAGTEPQARAAAGSSSAEVLRRLESVERRLSAVQARSAGPSSATSPELARAAAPGDAHGSVGDPVFEAAVLDVLERAEDERSSERNERRSERARQQAEHWAAELGERLALSPGQAAKLSEIRAQLQHELREQSSAGAGAFVPRAERRAARAALRERAEQQLRQVLEPQQVVRYEQLEGELRLVRPPDAD